MTLRGLPTSERLFASAVLLALALSLAAGLGLVRARELRPTDPNRRPPAQSRLVAVLEGVMAPNVTPAETQRFKAWVASGATRDGFVQVEAVVANNCASCHGDGGQAPRLQAFEDLRPLALEPATEGLAELLDARFLHLVAFPLLVAVAAGAYLRRARWTWRKGLMAGGGLAVAWDAGQWWLRQGRPEPHWAAWTGLGLLAAAMVAIAGAVLADLWLPDKG
jgi:mono/diheme cytochrome c family protein